MKAELLLVVLIASCQSVSVAADLLVHQPPRFPTEVQSIPSYVTASSSGYRGFDDFRLLGGGEISNVRWQGFLSDGRQIPSPDSASWVVSFSEDVDGNPGKLLYETSLDALSLSTTFRDTTSFGGRSVSVYDYSADLPNTFAATANERYWLSISVASEDRWRWMSGYGDDDQMLRASATSGQSSNLTYDAHFELFGNRQGDLPSNGQHVPGLSQVDVAIQTFMHSNTIESAVVGIMRDGDFVLQRGYGWQDEAHHSTIPEDAMMRLASITKPITAATIRELAGEGTLSLNDQVFDLGQAGGGILKIAPYGGLSDDRLKDVTVRDLLRHRGGWDRSISPDYAFWDLEIATQMGLPSPPGSENKASYILGQTLDLEPGTQFAYSNIGFMMLGLVIEQVTGQEYIDVVYDKVFRPIGVPRSEIDLGRTIPEERNLREPWYDQPARWEATNVYDPDGPTVPWPDGGWDNEAAESYGGLIASTNALLEFAEEYRLRGESIGTHRRSNEPNGSFWAHNGSLPGTNTILVQRADGTNFVVLLNRRSVGLPEYISDIGNELFELLSDVNIEWPAPLEFAGDANGDGWVTTDDVSVFSNAMIMTALQFALEFPDGHYRSLDFTGDGIVDRNDVPQFHRALIDSHNTDQQLGQVSVRGDVTHDWSVDDADVDLLLHSIATGVEVDDVDGLAGTTTNDLRYLIKDIFNTWFGDADLDGAFDSSDLVSIFTAGEYEDELAGNSTWGTGDWNADAEFDTSDLVVAFADGGYEKGPQVNAVPEPSSAALLLIGLLAILRRRRCGSK